MISAVRGFRRGTGLVWVVGRALALVAATAAAHATVLAAQAPVGVIEGRVTDNVSGRPLANAQVQVVGTTIGGATTDNGSYRITGVPARQVEVRVRLIGHAPASKTVTVAAGQTARADFTLGVSALQLEQVVVTGTGQQVEVRKLGNTIATVEPPKYAPIANPSELLTGRTPGVVMLPSSGLTGEGARIRIRGNASLSMSNEPIIFVDGIRVNNGAGFSGDNVGAGGGGNTSRLDDIDPSTIERVEVLKGAAAATLYGTEASNGVIQIFTKKGASGAPVWQFNLEQAASRYPDGRVKNQAGFARRQGQADSLSVFFGRPIKPYEIFEMNANDALWTTGKASILAGSVSGGTPGSTYFVSGRYARDDGPMGGQFLGPIRDFDRRAQGLTRVGLVPFSQLRVDVRASYADVHHEVPNNANNIYGVTSLAQFAKPELANCRAGAAAGDPKMGVASPGRCTGPGNIFGNAAFMTVREAMQVETVENTGRFTGAFDATWTPLSALSVTSTVGLDQTDSRYHEFAPFGYNVDRFTGNRPNGDRSIDAQTRREYTVDTKALWRTDFRPGLSSDFVAGVQGFISRIRNSGGNNQNFPGPGLEVVTAGSTPIVNETFSSTVNGGYFAQEQLGIANWVFATVGARYDYSSAFGESAGGVLYPKASLSVVPSDMDGWDTRFGLNTFRVRGAIGQSGRQPGAFDKLTTYRPLTSELGSGLAPANLGNPDLKPEVSTEWEGGAEFGFLDNRLGFDFTYWNRTVRDALVSKQFAPSGGFRDRQLANVGRLAAHGVDLSVKAFVVNRPGLAIDLFANGAYLKQKIVSLGGAPPIKVGGSYPRYRNFLIEGYGPGELFGAKLVQPCAARAAGAKYKCLEAGQLPFDLNKDGVPDSEASVLAFLSQARTLAELDPMMVDEDGDGDLLDHHLGKPYPDWQGAFGGNVNLGQRWRFGTLVEFRGGHYTVTNLTDAFRNAHPTIGRNTRAAAEVEATVMNPASTPQQRLEAAKTWAYKLKALSPFDGLNQNEKGDFIRWREVNVTYTASRALAARIGARELAFTLAGRNLMLFTGYTGVDPEVNAIGRVAGGGVDNNYLDAVDAFSWPIPRRVSLSVRLGY